MAPRSGSAGNSRTSFSAVAAAFSARLRIPPRLDLSHVARPLVTLEQRLSHLRSLLSSRGRFGFDEAVAGTDRVTQAITLFALLELYKAGEAEWEQSEPFAPITVKVATK